MSGGLKRLAAVRAERWGLLADLAFAIAWVTTVELLFALLEGPRWAYYLLMLSGIVAYFGFFWSLEAATAESG